MNWPDKDPDDVLDYSIDWEAALNGDVLTTSNWSISPSGLTVDASSINGDKTIVWLSGGDEGVSYNVTNSITTAGGRSIDRTVSISVRQR
tara:strand:- start:14413 stop:14682 length:270 start_codon:yes stop_codon:yes gene_type:complete